MQKANRVEQQFIKKGHPIYEVVDKYCFYSKNVYNQANYLIRQAFIKENKIISAFDVQKIMQPMDCYKECGSQAAQKAIQLVGKQWKSYFQAIKDWKKNPSKYLGMPKIPGYLPKDGRQVFMLKNIQCSLVDGVFRIAYKPFNQYETKTHAVGKLMQCRFVPKGSYYVMEIVYEIEVPDFKEETEKKLVEDNHNLIYTFLQKYHLTIDDWYGLAAIGLCKEAKTFVPGKSSFSTYAYKCMFTTVYSEKRKERQAKTIPDNVIVYYQKEF